MAWPNFLAPGWGFMGLLAVPLVLLYILRQKRPDMAVSSTLLWSKTLADIRASTPFQKLRNNLLLILQLLILAALVFTLMRPVILGQARQTRAGVIVIDATASMQTTDNGGSSRLERAKAEAKKLVDSMRPGDKYKLLSDGGGLNRAGYDFISSKSELKGLIDNIKASDSTSDLSETLILAAESLRAIGGKTGAAGPDKGDTAVAGKVWLFSDGAGVKLPDVMGRSADLLQFVKIGESSRSVGVTKLSITPVAHEPRTYQVFVGLKNAWDVERKVSVLLAHNKKDNYLNVTQSAVIPAGSQGSVVFEKVVCDPGKLFVLVDPTDDDFLLDNTAFGVMEPPRKTKVLLVTPKNDFLEQFLKTGSRIGEFEPVIVSPEHFKPAEITPDNTDLVMMDGVVPSEMPRVDTLLIRPRVSGPGDVGGFKFTNEIKSPALLSWKREDPLMQYVNLGELNIFSALLVQKDPELIELASAPEAPLIAYRDVGSTRRYLIAFNPLTDSNWWRQISLTIFLRNLIDQTRARHYIGMPQLLQTTTAAKLWNVGDPATGTGSVDITAPDGAVESVEAKNGSAAFEKTEKAGFYEVKSGKKRLMFAVNLLSPVESNIRPQSLQTSVGSNVEEATGVASVNREIWHWLAIAALVVLLTEWWVYHRRIA